MNHMNLLRMYPEPHGTQAQHDLGEWWNASVITIYERKFKELIAKGATKQEASDTILQIMLRAARRRQEGYVRLVQAQDDLSEWWNATVVKILQKKAKELKAKGSTKQEASDTILQIMLRAVRQRQSQFLHQIDPWDFQGANSLERRGFGPRPAGPAPGAARRPRAMRGASVYRALRSKKIFHLYHANSVVTSKSLLKLNGLASRGCVESHGLPQSRQYTDRKDRQYDIWNDVFTDGFDIHAERNYFNKYGPVLFVLDARILLDLPEGTKVYVTKTNPAKWRDGQSVQDRYFTTARELMAGLTYGDIDQHIVFRIAGGILPFGTHLKQIILDDPRVQQGDGSDVFTSALQSLRAAARARRIAAPFDKRACNFFCKCIPAYGGNIRYLF